MRTDIYVNTITGDIVLKNQNSLEEYLFEWIEETDLQLTAQIILPSNFDIKQLYTIGVQIKIPYTPMLFGLQDKILYASQLIMVSQDYYLIQINKGVAYLWSNAISDMVNINANIQNRNLLLQCVPSNNYRYPTSGVGLIKYLHANLSHSGLAEKLQTEFKDDKVEIINAAFNSYSGDLELDLDFSEADAGV